MTKDKFRKVLRLISDYGWHKANYGYFTEPDCYEYQKKADNAFAKIYVELEEEVKGD